MLKYGAAVVVMAFDEQGQAATYQDKIRIGGLRDGAAAKQLFAEGNALLDKLIADKALPARGVYGFFAANSDGDDIQLYEGKGSDKPLMRLHHLRQQAIKDGEPSRCLSDFVAASERGAELYRCVCGDRGHWNG